MMNGGRIPPKTFPVGADLSPIESFEDLGRITSGFMKSRIILSAVETDLFTMIGSNGISAKQLASKAGLSQRAVEIVLDALTAMGLLEKDGTIYKLGDIAAKYLSKSSESYIGASMLHRVDLWDNWSNLTPILRGEVTDWMLKRPNLTDPVINRSFILSMHDAHYPEALKMCQYLDLKGVKHMVDLGGGAGSYSIAFVNCFPGLRSTIIDLPQTLEVAKEVIESFELSDRIDCKPGDIYQDLMLPLRNDVDLFWVSHIIHQEGYEENSRLMKRIYKYLVPKGRIIINDHFLDDSRTIPEQGAIFAVNMLVNTQRGKSYTKTEVERMLTDAGFKPSFENGLMTGTK
jgi:predicted O-methyltransferase YrrM